MTDGMTAAAREADLAREETRIKCEMLRCLEDFERPLSTLLAIARVADEIHIPHGGGRSDHAQRLEDRMEALRMGDRSVWARLLESCLGGCGRWVNDVDDHHKVVDLYSRFKACSPFKNSVLFFSLKDSPEIADAAEAALKNAGYASKDDTFIFELTDTDPITVRPVWLRQTDCSSPWRTGPLVNCT